jgi:hypothetical protein
MKRRVQHYGWQYDYKASRVDSASYLGPLLDIFSEIAGRIRAMLG